MWIFLVLTTALVLGLAGRTTPRQDTWVMLSVTLVVVGFVAVEGGLG